MATSGSSRRSKASTKSARKPPSQALTQKQLLAFYRSMYLVRRFEEKVIELFQAAELPGFLHVCIGQEGIAVGVGQALQEGDLIGSTHRAHGHILARGSDPNAAMAELMGKVTGLCEGKGGSMHLADLSHGVVGANGVVGAGAPMMVGCGLSQKLRGDDGVSVAFYGDGASNQGNVHESLNLAQLWKLPVLFVLENNHYAESTPYWQQVPVKDLVVRGAAYDMRSISVDGNDVLAVYDETMESARLARAGEGPTLLVCETTRLEGHYVGDPQVYRPKGEAKGLRDQDPIERFATRLTSDHKVKESALTKLRDEVDAEMDAAVEFGRESELPQPQDAMRHLYSQEPYPGPVVGL